MLRFVRPNASTRFALSPATIAATKTEGTTSPMNPPNDDAHGTDEPVWAVGADDTDEVWADGPDSEDAHVVVAPPRDPWVNVLLVLTLSLVVTLIATTGALYFYLSTLNRAPRTMTERDVATTEAAAAEAPTNATSWAALGYAYARAGRYDDALEAVSRGEKLENGEALAVVRADILRLAGRHKDAVKEYDRAEEKTKQLLKRIKSERAKVGITRDELLDDGALFQVYWGRAMAREELGDATGAIADYELAALENPRQSTIWASLGDLYLAAGQDEKAAEAYRSALKYTPDMPEALEGLSKVEEGE